MNASPCGVAHACGGHDQKDRESTFDDLHGEAVHQAGPDVTAYEQIVQSCIVGQSHAWLREIGIQNPRDAIRKAREQWLLGMDEGKLQHRNYIENGNWIYSMSDPVGMDMWTLIRFYFPIDQSSKDYLADTGNLGQGNYTLYADFDFGFIRTSTGDGVIQEVVIANDPQKGPVVTSWSILEGDYKGTEVRRLKKQPTVTHKWRVFLF